MLNGNVSIILFPPGDTSFPVFVHAMWRQPLTFFASSSQAEWMESN